MRSVAKILVVDGDPVMQLAIQRALEQAGRVVGIAADGQKALAGFKSERFDPMVLDIFIPDMDGLESMPMILQHTPDVPIVMTWGRSHTPDSISEPDDLIMATKLGAVSALRKPFNPASLVTMVSDCLASAGKQATPPGPGHDAVPNS